MLFSRVMKMKEKWHQLIITDKNCLSGKSVHEIVKNVFNFFDVRVVIANDLVGAIDGLRGFDGEQLTSNEFLRKVELAVQYDWAFFYMFKSSVPVGFDPNDSTLAIQSADVTVRLADDSYVYIYTRDILAAQSIKNIYIDAALSTVELDDLEILF
jgi:hypothetical protein